MPRAIWNGTTIAESDQTVVVEGNHYFPVDSVGKGFLRESAHRSHCHWKGEASYYHLEVEGEVNRDAAWYYPQPFKEAKQIAGRIAFWRGVEVVD